MNRIVWRKWICPLEVNSAHLTDADHADIDQDAQTDHFSVDDHFPVTEPEPPLFNGKLLVGLHGVLAIHDHNLTSKLYKMWVGHTNFDVTQSFLARVERVGGVEILKPISRYRFLMGVGMLWDTHKVQADIEQLTRSPEERSRDLILEVLRRQAESVYPYWIICRQPDGELRVEGGSSREGVEGKINTAHQVIKKSWEC